MNASGEQYSMQLTGSMRSDSKRKSANCQWRLHEMRAKYPPEPMRKYACATLASAATTKIERALGVMIPSRGK